LNRSLMRGELGFAAPARLGAASRAREKRERGGTRPHVTLGKFPRPSAEAKAKQQKAPTKGTVLGLTLAPASAIAGAGEHGVVITEIDPSSRAAESGLQTGDVILDAGRRAVNTPAEVGKMVEEAGSQSKKAVLLRVQRRDTASFVAVPIG